LLEGERKRGDVLRQSLEPNGGVGGMVGKNMMWGYPWNAQQVPDLINSVEKQTGGPRGPDKRPKHIVGGVSLTTKAKRCRKGAERSEQYRRGKKNMEDSSYRALGVMMLFIKL